MKRLPFSHWQGLLAGLILLGATSLLCAQSGNDNPTGPAGAFNGNVNSAGSYDPYTGSAFRSVTDLTVPGAVSAYGLSYGRTWSSRGGAQGWSKSFGYRVEDAYDVRAGDPIPYTVSFPDGRMETFGPTLLGGALRTGKGTRERFQPGNPCHLLLPDGGKVEFTYTTSSYTEYSNRPPTVYTSYFFTTTALIDPYGQRINYSYNSDGSLYRLTDPSGRYLQFAYSGSQLAFVTGSDGRNVVYTYTNVPVSGATIPYPLLASVRYFGDPTQDATYTYAAPNVGSVNGPPVLKTCNDTMYAGPMKKIAYVYATDNNLDATPAVYGQILSENYFDGTNVGAPVSTLTMNSANVRTETRGDGPQRTFTYANGLLQSWTDFKNVGSSQTYDANLYVNSVTDRRQNRTDLLRDPFTGNITTTTFPLTGFDGGVRSTAQTTYGSASCQDANNRDGNNPYYPCTVTNERGYATVFFRDTNKRVTQVNYADGGYETFTYNGFGEVLSHRMTSGGTETFTYDGSGLLLTRTAPATPSDPNPGAHPTWYAYYGNGRLWYMTDPRGNNTAYEYNQRGQVTKVIHHDNTYLQYGYNPDGTVAWSADENHPGAATDPNQRTRYGYDDYKRVTSVTNPLNQTTSYVYAQDWAHPYLHTTTSLKGVFSPGGKVVHYAYDENWRRTIMREPTAEVDAWTYYGYDAGGNFTWTQDPRGNATTFSYDERDRRYATYAPLGQTTLWEYDRAGNLTKETRPDNRFRTQQFDVMNRLIQTLGFANEGTGYAHDLAGNVTGMQDAKGAYYSYGYDALNRKISATYPLDIASINRTETWHYDFAGNVDQYKNPANQVKTITYDNRNRPTNSSWSNGSGPTVATAYDPASRVTSISTNPVGNTSDTLVAFGYDNANRQVSETQTLGTNPGRVVTMPRDADGQRTGLTVAGFYALKYDYTGRGQLKTIYDGAMNPWFRHTYDLNGNLLKRQDVGWGINDSLNVTTPAGANGYDALNRPTVWEQTGSSDAPFARSWMQYDSLNRLTATWRDEQASKGERFGYDTIGQLISAKYNADQVWTGNPLNPSRTVTYNTDVLNRTGSNGVNENGTLTAYTPNPMNQYTVVGAQTPNYDANFNLLWMSGWIYSYDAEKRLTSAGNPSPRANFLYDGLGRCVKRTIDGVTTILAYDGWKPIVEWDGAGAFAAYNIYGAGPDEILWRLQNNFGHLRYKLDRQGNVAFLLDVNGAGLEKYTYDAFGQPTITDWNGNVRSQSAYGNRFMFTGREWLAPLGLYDYRNRMYQPQLGRFLQPDPLGFAAGDPNLFRYCGGDPVNRIDPIGKQYVGTGPLPPTDGRGNFTPPSVAGPGGPANPSAQPFIDFGIDIVDLFLGLIPELRPLQYMGPDPLERPGSVPDSYYLPDLGIGNDGVVDSTPWEQTEEGRASIADMAFQTALQEAEEMAWSRFYRPDQIGYLGDGSRGGGNGMLRSLMPARNPFQGERFSNGVPQNEAARRHANVVGPPGVADNLAWQKAGRLPGWWSSGH